MKKFLKILLIFVLALVVAIVLTPFVIRDAKRDIITLNRKPIPPKDIDKMADDLVSQMTLEEKVGMMTPHLRSNFKFMMEIVRDGMKYNQHAYAAGGNERLKIPAMRFFDGPRGLVSGPATCFPVALQRAATFDPDLEYQVGKAISEEIRASGGNYFGGVCINLLRHPAGGRAQESYGEDPFLLGAMGSAMVRGIQYNNVMACVKHFALNNQENTRFKINVDCEERVLREVYLPHFKTCIEAGAASVMGAYNKFRGEQCCQNSHLLRDILKDDWGFQGFTISDFVQGVRNTAKAANGGLDIEMPAEHYYGKQLIDAVQAGTVAEEVVNASAQLVARTVLRFETAPDPRDGYPERLVGNDQHISLALKIAEKSMVLLQNKNNVLPLDDSKTKNVLVVGKLAKSENIGDHGSSQVRPKYVVTPLQGLQRLYGDKVNFIYDDGLNIDSTRQKAASADAVLFVVGYNHDDEGEYIEMGSSPIGGDRKSIRLHPADSKMIQAVGPANPESVVVLIGGSAIIMEEWKDKVAAIVDAFYPGMEGGTALAKVLFGAVNPGGKLPFSIAADEQDYPAFDRLATQVTYDRFQGYTKLDHDGKKAAFPFGFGLSYTTFDIDSASVQVQDQQVIATARVTNTGSRAGDQVVQLYIGYDNSVVERAHKLLSGFKRISLAPGASQVVTVSCPLEKLRWYSPESHSWELEKMEYQAYIGFSSNEDDLQEQSFLVE